MPPIADDQYTSYLQSAEHQVNGGIRCFYAVLAEFGVPKSMVDVGCGAGFIVDRAIRLGIKAVGWDLYADENHPDRCRVDLAEPATVAPFELVLCWEVAEHLPFYVSDDLVTTLVNLVQPDGHLIFTAAQPEQGGPGHLNEQPLSHWRTRFVTAGLTYLPDKTERLKSAWSVACGPCWWYEANLQVFQNL